jgi:hypothetical protein
MEATPCGLIRRLGVLSPGRAKGRKIVIQVFNSFRLRNPRDRLG